MDIKQILEQFGLVGKKADVYLAALKLGSGTVIEISRNSGVKRTTCYDILLDLSADGLISKTAVGKKHLFVSEDPEKIQINLQKKERLLSEILPQLNSLRNTDGTKPKIRFYEGKGGLREVYADTLKDSKEILIFGSYDVVDVLGSEWAERYLKKRVAKQIYAKAILPNTDKLIQNYTSRDQEQRRSTKLIDAKKYPFSIEINIYSHQKLALISAKEEMAIIIEGAEIHKTLRLMFELIWDLLPEIKIK